MLKIKLPQPLLLPAVLFKTQRKAVFRPNTHRRGQAASGSLSFRSILITIQCNRAMCGTSPCGMLFSNHSKYQLNAGSRTIYGSA